MYHFNNKLLGMPLTAKLLAFFVWTILGLDARLVHAQDNPSNKQVPECPEWRLEHAEFDVFPSPGKDSAFARTDLSTAVVTNSGNVPVLVTIKYFEKECLRAQPQAKVNCTLLDTRVTELYPGGQSVTIINLGEGLARSSERREIAYRVLVEYMAYYSLEQFNPETVQKVPEEELMTYAGKMEVKVDFYRNLKLVDCLQENGIPALSQFERDQTAVQCTQFTNWDGGIPREPTSEDPPDPRDPTLLVRRTGKAPVPKCRSPYIVRKEDRARARQIIFPAAQCILDPPIAGARDYSEGILNGGSTARGLQGINVH